MTPDAPATPDREPKAPLQLHPRFQDGIPLDDIPNLTDEQIDAIFPNFVPVWRGFLRELAAAHTESESA